MSTRETQAAIDRFASSCTHADGQYSVTIGTAVGHGVCLDEALNDALAKAGISHEQVAAATQDAMLRLAETGC